MSNILVNTFYIYVMAIQSGAFNQSELLQADIKSLPFSATFLKKCDLMNFQNLQQIFDVSPEQLLKMPGFTYAWLGELGIFLTERGLLYLLQKHE